MYRGKSVFLKNAGVKISPPNMGLYCNGQLLDISENTALYSLIGTTYGGNGSTTFALPNLAALVAMHFGGGSGGGK